MTDLRPLEGLKALHRELLSVREHRFDDIQTLDQLVEAHTHVFRNFLDKKPRNTTSRTAVQSGKINLGGDEYSINEDFANDALKLADELDLDELEAARVLLDADAEDDQEEAYGRPLWECGIIRFHQEREYLLDCMRLSVEIANDEDLDRVDPALQDGFGAMVEDKIFCVPLPGAAPRGPVKKFVPKCMAAMQNIKTWLQALGDRMAARSVLTQPNQLNAYEPQETYEFSRLSLVQQHELIAVLLCSAIEMRHVEVKDFEDFLGVLKKIERYDHLLVHLFPVLGEYITVFGSTEGTRDIQQVRLLNDKICGRPEDNPWFIPNLSAAVRAWWISEYSGVYLDDTVDIPGVNLDEEDEQRTKQFLEALKDGAFDFVLSVAADCKAQEWQDPARLGMRQWLQRKSPPLASDPFPFAPFFQRSLMMHLEVFVDAAISNIPDILRKLRTEEDEQRQLSQTHEQDLDLERFLIIIAYAYEGRPDAAMSFWEDPDSNLAGFLQWASKRASTPLVSAFCEMLQALSDDEECATAAHMFLLDEGYHSSGKMKRSQSLTWSQILKELEFFTAKIRERPSPAQSHMHRLGKPSNELAETEPESAMMLECYLRLIAKLSTESEAARTKLLQDGEKTLFDTLFKLAASPIPPRLRACTFYVFKAFLSNKTAGVNEYVWRLFDQWLNTSPTIAPRGPALGQNPSPNSMMSTLEDLSNGFEESNALIQVLISLFVPVEDTQRLNDTLPFPEDLGIQCRIPGIEVYVDYVLGHIFGNKSSDITDANQLRILRLSCLEFTMTCLETFNEDLITLGHETNITIDQAIATSDLAAYVRLHPFARVMEWMFDNKVVKALISTVHQESAALSSTSPDSPLVLSILRAVEVMLKVLELQDTYLYLVRPTINTQGGTNRISEAKIAYSSFEEGIMNHLNLVVDLGKYCGIRHPPLTLACLKLLERISTSPKIISAWNPDAGLHGRRNKAIVQLEKNGEGEAIAASLSAEITDTLDPVLEAESQNYLIKLFILDFLYECLRATPDQPTIAHLLLGFHCQLHTITVEPRSTFDAQKSLFHNLLNVFIRLSVYQEERGGMRSYLVALKHRVMRVFQVLWSSPLSSAIVMEELRATNFVFHTLLHEIQLQPKLRWDDLETGNPEFLLTDASLAYIDFLGTRAMAFEYIGKELCSVSQNRIPTTKRQIFDALNGQIKADSNEPINVPNIFDFFDFLSLDGQWDIAAPQFGYYKDLDLSGCAEEDPVSGLQYNAHKVQEVLWLKRNESRNTGQLIPQDEMLAIEREEVLLMEYIVYTNRYRRFTAHRLKLLRAWTNLLLVMLEANDFKGTPKMAFLLQTLQAILPSLEAFSTMSAAEAYELARAAKVLLFKLDFFDASAPAGLDKDSVTIGNLISDKLFQLFQVCLNSIGRWAGSAELRAVYYSICYRYLTGVVDKTASAQSSQRMATSRQKTVKTILAAGERLLNVICDDAYGSDTNCQTAAMILLGALAHLGRADDDASVVDTLNRLNFIGVLVDSLKTILQDWLAIIKENNLAAEQYAKAKLALLLQLCQTRPGAKFVLQANLFRALELAGVFAADPELEIDVRNTRALEKHYGLLVSLARIIGAAVLARGSHNVLQGRKFLKQHRMMVVHTLKRSAGIGTVGNGGAGAGAGAGFNGMRSTYNGHGHGASVMTAAGDTEAQAALEERIEELAEAFMLLITATGFLEVKYPPHIVLFLVTCPVKVDERDYANLGLAQFEDDQTPAERPRVTSTTLFH
ncbi:nucleoporin Nup186/Nup192/Nup205 [Apodospora peruviana]|uniref:Nucleoporin Nup186/Nup192/Nup205 n=1 Tax=Apodospora peruviana TaxID=516989 RepID=A0AAE0IBY7_9PEZI|nr:nucleoporin Nup186/Nup192/Nup205 [Apodospora peruviana]